MDRPIRKAIPNNRHEPRSLGPPPRNLNEPRSTKTPPVIDRGSDKLLQALELALMRRAIRARTDFNEFAPFVLRDNLGTPVEQAAIHRVWHAHVDSVWASEILPGTPMLCGVLAPYGHGKTQQLVVGRAAWEIGRDINLRAKIISNVDPRAMERLLGIQALIRSQAYREIFPHVRQVTAEEARREGKPARWTQHELYLARPGFAIDASIHAAGVTSAGTGGRADLEFFDDCVDEQNALAKPVMRDLIAQKIDNVWLQRLEPNGRVLYVGTPWHQADYSHRILKDRRWCVLRQWISNDQSRIHQEVYNPPANYPIPVYSRIVRETGRVEQAATWV